MENNSSKTAPGRPFPKGTSGNPNGRPPKEWTWRSLLLEVAEELAEGSQEPKKMLMARKLVEKGMEGDATALKEFGDRIDGKASQGIELTGKNGGPMEASLTVVFQKPDGG